MFEQTVPQDIGVLATIPNTISDVADKIRNGNGEYDAPLTCLYQYKLSNEKDYRYFYYTQENPNDSTNLIHDYECRIRFNLETGEHNPGTSEWGSQNYMYAITLVSGQKMTDTLLDAKEAYPELDWREDWPVKLADETDNEYTARLEEWLNTETKNENQPFPFVVLKISHSSANGLI